MNFSPTPNMVAEKDGPVGRLIFNKPQKHNATSTDMWEAIPVILDEFEKDPAIRVVILTGAGRMFCAGGDVAGFSSAGSDLPRLLLDLTAPLHMAVARLAGMPKPVITAVNGAAAGAEGEGVAGLRQYIRDRRQPDFVKGFAGKMLAYALDRSLILSDEPLIEQISNRLAATGYHFETVIDEIITSRQFLTKRGS